MKSTWNAVRKTFVYTVSVLLLSLIGFSNPKNANAQTTWCETIGRPGIDVGYSIIQTSDSGYAIVGCHSCLYYNTGYVYLIKLDSLGAIQWTRIIVDSSGYGRSIIQTPDGGYVIAGYTSSFGAGGYDVYVIKFDGNGNVQWTKTIGGPKDDRGYSVIQTLDGGYAVVGNTCSFGSAVCDNVSYRPEVYLIKLDSVGNVEWTKIMGDPYADYAYSIIQTSDSGYAIVGDNLIKLDANWNIQWVKSIKPISQADATSGLGYSIIQTSDGGYAIAGIAIYYYYPYGEEHDVYVVKLDANGNVQWSRGIELEGYYGSWDEGYSIIQTLDGGYAVTGYTESFYGLYILRLDASGNIQWARTISGSSGYSIIKTYDGGYAIAGTYDSDVFIMKLDANFNTCSACGIQTANSNFSSSNSQVSSPALLTNNVNSSVSSGGNVSTGGTLTLICSSDIIENNFDKSTSLCYSNGKIKINFGRVYENISIGIKDVSGREIMRKELKNVDRTELDIKGNTGVYFIELKNKDRRVVFKVIKAR